MSAAAPAGTAPAPEPAGDACEPSELALWMGQLLMDHGAESERVEQTMRVCAESLGCDWSALLVTHDALLICERETSATLLRRARPRAVDMSLIEALSHLRHRCAEGRLQPHELKAALTQLEGAGRHYSALLTGVAVALACAAFSRLFSGDWGAFAATFVGSGGAMLLRHYHARYAPNRLVFAAASAFVAALIVGILQRACSISTTPGAAYVACALMVVPGVPAINAVQDLIKGHLGVALARAAEAALLVLAGTLGISLGLGLSWVQL